MKKRLILQMNNSTFMIHHKSFLCSVKKLKLITSQKSFKLLNLPRPLTGNISLHQFKIKSKQINKMYKIIFLQRFNLILDEMGKVFSIFFFIVTFLLSGNLLAQQALNRAIKRGLDLEYNFKWKNAEDVFQSIVQKYPNDPRGYHYQASIYLWKYNR